MGAMQRGRELLLVGRRPRNVIRRRGIVVDFAQGDAMAAPASFERACVHVIYQDAFVQEAVRDDQFTGVFVEVEGGDSRRKNVGLLVVLLHLRSRNLRPPMAEVPKK